MYVNLLAVILGYFFGSFQTAYILGRTVKGVDIRETGSKNAGTSNMVQTFGWKLGILTFLGDILKVIIPLFIAKYYFRTDNLFNLLLGIGGILGHNFPFYMGFKGGKGTATTLGMLLVFDYRICLVVSLILVILMFITDYIALASLIAIALIPVVIYFYMRGLNLILISTAIPALSVYMHRGNISNLLAKKEPRISSVFEKKKDKTKREGK
jgi:glycerol-3-phosphate acyltransferase PlsY